MHITLDRATAHPVLPSLTGLRFVAAFVVFAFHVSLAGYVDATSQPLTAVFGAGATGVSLFFILSGFVLSWSDRPGQSVLRFWRNRVARVYPLHLAALCLALVLAATIVPGIATSNPWAVLSNATLTSSWRAEWWQAGNPVSWSLVCEAFFYLVFPLLIPAVRHLRNTALGVTTIAAIALVIILPPLVDLLALPITASTSPLTRFPEFLVGILVARVVRTGLWGGTTVTPALGLTVAGYLASLAWHDSPWSFSGFTVIGFCLLIVALARADVSGRGTVLSTRPAVALGILSFPFYLVHLLVVQAAASAFPDAPPLLPALPAITLTTGVFVGALALAWVLHRVVELPGRRLVLRSRRAPATTVRPDTALTPMRMV